MARPTFELITDEAVYGSYEDTVLKADKLPALKHGMEQWELKYSYEGKLLNKEVVKCKRGQGASEALAIISESAPYWNRKAKENV